MSSGGQRRLQRIEAALIPTEAMAVWLQDLRSHHRSRRPLVDSLQGKPGKAFLLFTLTGQPETVARARAKQQGGGTDLEGVDRAERDAVRDGAMLFYLFMQANGQFLEEKRALCLLVALLLHSIHDWFRDSRMPQWDEPLDRRLQLAVEELYGWQRAVAMLGERYFQGVCALLPETEEQLGWIVVQGELLVELFNDHLEFEGIARKANGKRKPPLPKPFDLVALKRSAEPGAKALVAYQLALARAQACEMMGEQKRGIAYIERQLMKAI